LESLTVNTWPDLPARIQTAMKFPAVLVTLNEIDAVVVVPASWLARWTRAIPGVAGRTVKFTPLLAAPPTVTTTAPVVVPDGTVTTILVAFQLVGAPAVPLKATVLAPCVGPKFAPLIVTEVPTAPDAGLKLVMLGGGGVVTVKVVPLLATPPTVTMTFPAAAPAGTGATMLVALQLVGVAVTPLNFTVLVPCVAPKFVPAIVTEVPTGPEAGFRLVMLGGGGVVTVKVVPLLATPPTVTITFPVAAPGGTGATMLVALQLAGVAVTPLNFTVLVPCVAPKFAPLIVTDVPTAPDVGFKLVMLGGSGVVTVKFIPLLASPPTVTTTFPVVAPDWTTATMLVALQLVGVAAMPLNFTVLVSCVAPKFAPLMVTDVPTAPDVGFKLVMLGGGGVTAKLIPLLATPPAMTTRFPVAAPAGTGATMPVALQLAGVAVIPLNFTVLVPCAAPKFAPLMVTDVPTAPDAGLKLVTLGGETAAALPGLKAAKAAPQLSGAPRIALADTVPEAACILSSAINLVFGAAGTLPSMANPFPAVKLAELADETAPSNKSPLEVVVAVPLFGDTPFPWAIANTSREFVAAIPEYSTIAIRKVSEIVSDTVIVFVPPAIFSA
jgi:hypothetical protein